MKGGKEKCISEVDEVDELFRSFDGAEGPSSSGTTVQYRVEDLQNPSSRPKVGGETMNRLVHLNPFYWKDFGVKGVYVSPFLL